MEFFHSTLWPIGGFKEFNLVNWLEKCVLTGHQNIIKCLSSLEKTNGLYING